MPGRVGERSEPDRVERFLESPDLIRTAINAFLKIVKRRWYKFKLINFNGSICEFLKSLIWPT